MRLSLLSGIALALIPAFAHAQEASNDGFDEIIVTAERQSSNLQDTPIAVSALSAQQMEERGLQSIRDLSNVVPSLQINQQTNAGGAGSLAFWIRGLGQERSMLTTQPSVPLYIDDFYYPSISGNVLRAMDIEQVEVLRGPQGTLFGRNSTGGAVRYMTRKPGDEFGGYVEGTAGSFDRRDIVGVINVPITDQLFLRATGASMNTDGFVEHDLDDDVGGATENRFGRIALRFQPSENLTFDLSHEEALSDVRGSTEHNDVIDGTGSLVALYTLAGATPAYDSSFDSSCNTCAPGGLPVDDFSRTNVFNTHFVADWQVNNNLRLKLLSGQSIVTDSWSNDVDSSPAEVGRQYQPHSEAEAISHELQALGNFGARINYVVGAYYYDESQEGSAGQVFTFPVMPGVGVLLRQEALAHTYRTSESVYGNVSFDLSDALTLTTGLRLLEDTVEADIQATYPAVGPIGRAEVTTRRALPMLRLQYDISDDIMTYASASQGYRGGGFTPVSSSAELMPFAPESVWSYEIGARTEFGRVRFNPTLFYMDYENIQLGVQYTPNPMSAPTLILENGGRAHIYGFELDSTFNVTDRFTINLSGAITEGGYDEISPTISNIDLDSPIPHVAKYFYAIGGRYRIPFDSGAQTTFNLDYSWRSDQHSSANSQDDLIIEAYGLLNGQVMYDSPSGAWSIAVFGTNLTDEEYFTGGLNLTALVGNLRRDIGRPQEFGIRTQINF